MKTLLTLLLLIVTCSAYGQETPPEEAPPVEATPEKQDDIYEYLDEIAEYPGGMAAMRDFLQKNINYPPSAVAKKITGKCYLRFVVSKTGKVTNVKVARGVTGCPECDAEAVRVVKLMPNWIPGKNDGKPVNSYFNLPIAFQL